MATKTLQELRKDVLLNIFVGKTEESDSAGDAIETEAVIRSVFDELRGDNLAPFDLTAIPEWAQIPMRDIVSFDMAYKAPPSRRAELAQLRELGLRRMRRQTSADLNPAPIKGLFF